MIPPSNIVEFIIAWPSTKASIEQKLADDYDINSGELDPVLLELFPWHSVLENHLESVGRFKCRLNGVLDLSDFREDLSNSLTAGDTAQQRMVAFEIMGLAKNLKDRGRSTRVDLLKSDIDVARAQIIDLIDQRLRNIGYKWVLGGPLQNPLEQVKFSN
jgi:hypothetical protein